MYVIFSAINATSQGLTANLLQFAVVSFMKCYALGVRITVS